MAKTGTQKSGWRYLQYHREMGGRQVKTTYNWFSSLFCLSNICLLLDYLVFWKCTAKFEKSTNVAKKCRKAFPNSFFFSADCRWSPKITIRVLVPRSATSIHTIMQIFYTSVEGQRATFQVRGTKFTPRKGIELLRKKKKSMV